MRARRRRAPVAVLLASVAVLAGGCADPGSSPAASSTGPATEPSASVEPSPGLPATAEVFLDTRTSALAADSGRVEGTLPRSRRAVSLRLEGSAAGANQRAVVDAGRAGTAEVLTVDGARWLSGDVEFWQGRGERLREARRSATGWHEVTEGQARRVAPWTLRTLLTDWFGRPDVAALESDTRTVSTDESRGRELWVLGRAGAAQLWVAADGSGELVRLLLPGPVPTDVVFSEWGRVAPLTAPPAADVLRC